MKFIDLFSGIGGFRLGFEAIGFQCVFSCEINSKCRDVYQENFNALPFDDIQKINPQTLQDFDLLVAGFPCQPFSICGKKRGFEDTRGTLFFEICRIIKAKQPKIIILENVKHLIHHDQGNTLKIILSSLEELGYGVNYQILNSKDFGLPQHRERIFIIGTQNREFDFYKLKRQSTPKLRYFLDKAGEFEFLKKSEYTLIDSPRSQASGLIFVGYRNKGTWKTGVRPNTEHLSRVHRQPNRIYSIDGVHPTIPSQETSGRFFIYIPEQDCVRKLTLPECYRIMGFPDTFKSHPNGAESYKQIGNSVCVPVVKAIAQEILNQDLLSNHSYELPRKTEEYIQWVF
jgi:DNA (cytosine-5)-methyltransferase 1